MGAENKYDSRENNASPDKITNSSNGKFALIGLLRHNAEYRIRFWHACFVMWMFITLGWDVAVVGGTFPDLRLIIKKDLDTASWIFTAGGLGYLVGAFVGGFLFDRMNRLLLFIGLTTLNGVCIAAYPWCSTFETMLAISFASSLFTGGMDVGGNAHIASIWGQDSAPFMQMIHFGFSFGGIISPLTAEPFLAPKSCPEISFSNLTSPETTTSLDITTEPTIECEEVYGETHIHYAYLIAGIVSLTASLPYIILYLLSGKRHTYVDSPMNPVDLNSDQVTGNTEQKQLPVLPVSQKVVFVALLMLLISLYACSEGRFSSLLTTFLADHLDWSTNTGLHVTSLFWGTFSAGRLLGILVTRFLKTQTMLFLYLVVLTLVLIGMFFAATYNITELIWACTALIGLSMSVIFPAIFAWTGESILTVTGTISSVYIVGVSASNMALPLLYGYMMDNFKQMYFVDLLIAQCVICIGLYIAIRILVKIYIETPRARTMEDRNKTSMLY